MNMVSISIIMKSRTSSNLGHVGSKTRSQPEVIEKPVFHSRDHIFFLSNLYEIWLICSSQQCLGGVQNRGHMLSKMGSWDQMMEIPILCLVNTLETTFFVQSSRKLVTIIFSNGVTDKFESGACELEN